MWALNIAVIYPRRIVVKLIAHFSMVLTNMAEIADLIVVKEKSAVHK
mgnify:CR=1 FL=1